MGIVQSEDVGLTALFLASDETACEQFACRTAVLVRDDGELQRQPTLWNDLDNKSMTSLRRPRNGRQHIA
jgi:hypothetical protein